MTDNITIHKGGTGEHTVKVSELVIPDLWHVAMFFNDQAEKHANDHDSPFACNRMKMFEQMVLECWHLAHAMKDQLQADQA
jgi:hypothetical protein